MASAKPQRSSAQSWRRRSATGARNCRYTVSSEWPWARNSSICAPTPFRIVRQKPVGNRRDMRQCGLGQVDGRARRLGRSVMSQQKARDDLRLDRPIEADEPVGGQSRPLTMPYERSSAFGPAGNPCPADWSHCIGQAALVRLTSYHPPNTLNPPSAERQVKFTFSLVDTVEEPAYPFSCSPRVSLGSLDGSPESDRSEFDFDPRVSRLRRCRASSQQYRTTPANDCQLTFTRNVAISSRVRRGRIRPLSFTPRRNVAAATPRHGHWCRACWRPSSSWSFSSAWCW